MTGRITHHDSFKVCEKCGQESSWFVAYCAAWVCGDCEHHQGLARCYCGWAASGGDGIQELVDRGEVIGEEL